MKTSELKRIIKPLIRQSIKEVLLEEGILSKLIQETIIGVKSAEIVLNENKKEREPQITKKETAGNRKKLLDAIGKEKYGGVDLFEGTTPIQSSDSQYSPLSNEDPSNSGVDISNLPGMGNWNKLL